MEPKLTQERQALSNFIDARLSEGKVMKTILNEVKKMVVDKTLVSTRGNISETSKTLSISRGTVSTIHKG